MVRQKKSCKSSGWWIAVELRVGDLLGMVDVDMGRASLLRVQSVVERNMQCFQNRDEHTVTRSQHRSSVTHLFLTPFPHIRILGAKSRSTRSVNLPQNNFCRGERCIFTRTRELIGFFTGPSSTAVPCAHRAGPGARAGLAVAARAARPRECPSPHAPHTAPTIASPSGEPHRTEADSGGDAGQYERKCIEIGEGVGGSGTWEKRGRRGKGEWVERGGANLGGAGGSEDGVHAAQVSRFEIGHTG